MADAKKHHHHHHKLPPFNGGLGALISDLKSLLTQPKITKRSLCSFVYGFMFAFVLFTVFLSYNPSPTSSSSSPWFSNIFSTISTANSDTSTTSSSTWSDGSQFSSILSYLFPNSTSLSSQNTTLQAAKLNQESSMAKNQTIDQVSKPNQTRIQAPKSPTEVKNQTQSNEVAVSKPNQTTSETPKSPMEIKNQTQSDKVAVLKPYQTTNEAPKSPMDVKNQTQNQDSHEKVGVPNTNQSRVGAPKPPVAENQTANSAPNSSLGVKNITGNGDKGIAEKDVVANLTSSFSKKQRNETILGVESEKLMESLVNCDLFHGEWVRDDSYPLYKPGSCSLIDEQFNCFANGRPDKGFQQFKWKPQSCTLPRLDGSHMLEMLRGKRLVFVGDSLNRNMWESLVCILRNSVKDQNNVYEASGRKHFRSEASYSFVFKDYNCTIEFFVSPFLVQEWEVPETDGSKQETLRLDKIDTSADKYKNADVLIFNTGHWWTHTKTSEGKGYYQEGTHIYPELNVLEAFRKAVTTWARWVDANVNPTRTSVFFRGYSASHFSGGQWNSGGQCDHETEPIKNETYLSEYPPKMRVLEKVLRNMQTRVSFLNITRLTDYRKDGHPSLYRKQHYSEEETKSPLTFQDCSHWCLPGVPDAWNELLYAQLLVKQYQKQRQEKKTIGK